MNNYNKSSKLDMFGNILSSIRDVVIPGLLAIVGFLKFFKHK